MLDCKYFSALLRLSAPLHEALCHMVWTLGGGIPEEA